MSETSENDTTFTEDVPSRELMEFAQKISAMSGVPENTRKLAEEIVKVSKKNRFRK